jgi:transposase
MKITRVGLDIAKQVFQVHGVDEHGKARLRKQLSRAKVLEFFAQMPACLIGVEACGGAHYWGREPRARSIRVLRRSLCSAPSSTRSTGRSNNFSRESLDWKYRSKAVPGGFLEAKFYRLCSGGWTDL